MNYEKIVTLYDTADHAETARRNLEAAGFASRDISLVSGKTLGVSGDKLFDLGLWHRLFGREVEKQQASLYGRTIESGGVVLSVRVPETDAARAMAILNAHHAVVRNAMKEEPAPAEPITKTAAMEPPTAKAAGGAVTGEEVLSLAEEQLDVGKRMVQEGTTRIRRFVTERPVEAQITLHEEHVRVIRRASSDPNFTRNIDWTEKTIEAIDTMEEPVVTKSSHVTEEVVIRKEGTDRVQTVKDKVRKQDIKVETERGDEGKTRKAS